MDSGPSWLAGIPVDRVYVIVSGVLLVIAVALRTWCHRTSVGRAVAGALHALEAGFVATLLAAMLVLSFLQIVLRNMAETGLIWVDPLLRHLLLWIGFSGAALATRLGRHIRIDLLSRVLPSRPRQAARSTTAFVASFACLLVSNACLKMMKTEADAGTTSFLGIPIWSLQIVMPLAMWLMSYRFLYQVFETSVDQEEERPLAESHA